LIAKVTKIVFYFLPAHRNRRSKLTAEHTPKEILVEKLIIAHLVEKKNVCRLEITVYYPKRMQMLQSSGKN
jgi:hypothetical protein